MLGMTTTPDTEDLFEVSDSPPLLGEDSKKYFRTMTANLLFLSKRARLELQ